MREVRDDAPIMERPVSFSVNACARPLVRWTAVGDMTAANFLRYRFRHLHFRLRLGMVRWPSWGMETPLLAACVRPSTHSSTHAVGEASVYVQGESLKTGAAP